MRHLLFLGKRVAVLLVLVFSTLVSFAQPDPSCDPADPLCPIDDYYGVLIVAVVLLAAYKAYKRKSLVVPNL